MKVKMKKSDLAKKISYKINYVTNQDIDGGIISVLNLISESLQNRDRVEIRGFGSFSARRRSSRIARNPNTKPGIHINQLIFQAILPQTTETIACQLKSPDADSKTSVIGSSITGSGTGKEA